MSSHFNVNRSGVHCRKLPVPSFMGRHVPTVLIMASMGFLIMAFQNQTVAKPGDLRLNSSSNFVLNPSFEFGTAGWQTYGKPSLSMVNSQGERSARIDGASGFEQTVTGLKPFTSYRLVAQVRSLSGQEARIGVRDYGAKPIQMSTRSPDFAAMTVEFTTGNSTSAIIYFHQPEGSSLADEFSLTTLR